MSKATTFMYDEYDQILEVINADSAWYNGGMYLGIDENYFDLNYSSISEKDLLYGRLLSKKDIINKIPYAILREDTGKNIPFQK